MEVVRRLENLVGAEEKVLLRVIEGDHFEVSDFLDKADRFIFVDAVAGEIPGQLAQLKEAPRAFSPSFHQTDISAVMHCLEKVEITRPFPQWEIQGITILPPEEIGEGLSPEVDKAVETLCDKLLEIISSTCRE